MSLIAWYKLDGNANDSSGNNRHLSTISATYSAAGKINGAYSFASGNRIYSSTGMDFPAIVSVSAWGYSTSFDNNPMLFSFNSPSFAGPDLFFSTASSTICWNVGDSATSAFKISGTNVSFPSVNEWHHYVVLNDGFRNKAYLYIDGVYSGETTYRNTTQANRGFTIGNYHPASSSYAWRGMIDDFRIYDHILSEREIKELAKAKVLHYSFDDFQRPTVNLITNPTREVVGTYEFVQYIDLAPIFDTYGTDKPYSLSLDMKSADTSNTINVLVYMQNGSNTRYTFVNTYVGVSEYYSRYEFSDLTPVLANPGVTQAMLAFYGTYGTGNYPSIKNVQLEMTRYCTPFVDGSRPGIVKDQSGFSNDAELEAASSPEHTTFSAIGSGAYYFSGDAHIHLAQSPIADLNGDFSVSVWIRATDVSTDNTWQRRILGINGSSAGKFDLSMFESGGIAIRINETPYTTPAVSLLYDWHHIVFTKYGTTYKVYIDGQEQTLTNTGLGSHSTYPGVLIGRAYYSSIFRGGFIGLIDDVRIYSTALSTSDVFTLYRTRASLNANGLLLTHELNEERFNRCPPFEDWTMYGNAHVENGELVIPDYSSYAISPYMYIGQDTNWYWGAEWFATQQSNYASYQPNAGFLMSSSYYNSDFALTPNTADYTGNGHANSYPVNQWTAKYWSGNGGNDVQYLKLQISGSSTYAQASGFRVRRPTVSIVSYTDDEYIPFSNNILDYYYSTNQQLRSSGILNAQSFSETGVTDGLIGWWPFDGNANDLSFSKNDGTVSGASVAVGTFGKCYSFDGTDDYIQINSVNVETVNAIIDLNNVSAVQYFFGSATASRGIRYNGETFLVFGETAVSSAIPWTKVAGFVMFTAARSGSDWKLYINGSLIGTATGAGALSINRIGRRSDGYYFNGKMRDVRFYNRALTAAEINVLYDMLFTNNKMKITKHGVYVSGEFDETLL